MPPTPIPNMNNFICQRKDLSSVHLFVIYVYGSGVYKSRTLKMSMQMGLTRTLRRGRRRALGRFWRSLANCSIRGTCHSSHSMRQTICWYMQIISCDIKNVVRTFEVWGLRNKRWRTCLDDDLNSPHQHLHKAFIHNSVELSWNINLQTAPMVVRLSS